VVLEMQSLKEDVRRMEEAIHENVPSMVREVFESNTAVFTDQNGLSAMLQYAVRLKSWEAIKTLLEISQPYGVNPRVSCSDLVKFGQTDILRLLHRRVSYRDPMFADTLLYISKPQTPEWFDALVEYTLHGDLRFVRTVVRLVPEAQKPLFFARVWWDKLKYFYVGTNQSNFYVPKELVLLIIFALAPMLGWVIWFDDGDTGEMLSLFDGVEDEQSTTQKKALSSNDCCDDYCVPVDSEEALDLF